MNHFRLQLAPLSVMLMAVALGLGGCNYIGYAAHAIAGDRVTRKNVPAEYRGLKDKSVAVLVAADAQTLYRYPGADRHLVNAISGTIARDVEGAKVFDAEEAIRFQRQNPYWNTMPYSELGEKLEVERLVIVDLVEYATHAVGNVHEWRGTIVANLGVVETDGERPNDFTYATIVRVDYPSDGELGLVNSSSEAIELGLLRLFSQSVTDLFHTYQTEVKQ